MPKVGHEFVDMKGMLDARNTTVCGKYTRGLTDFTMKICDILNIYIYSLHTCKGIKIIKTSFPPNSTPTCRSWDSSIWAKILIFLVLVIYNFRTNGISD